MHPPNVIDEHAKSARAENAKAAREPYRSLPTRLSRKDILEVSRRCLCLCLPGPTQLMIMQELGRALAASSVWAVEGGQDQVQDEELDEPDEEPATTPRPSMGNENVVVARNLQ